MQLILDYITKNSGSIFSYLAFFIVGCAILIHLAKVKDQRVLALTTMELIHVILKDKIGDKADIILSIWIEGLKKIQDGEFSQDDGIDQFVRFVRLIAGKNNIVFSDSEIESLRTLVATTLHIFLNKKSKEIDLVVNKFSVKNDFQIQSITT
jgi:phosphotransferase system IIB component